MSAGRVLQVTGFVVVTVVLVRSVLTDSTMLFEFGGLAAGAGVFLLGRALESRAR
jgi:hypothetical protein